MLCDSGGDPEALVKERGLVQVSGEDALNEFVTRAMEQNPKSVEDYRNGKKAAAKALMGAVMKMSAGKANPQKVSALIEERLNQ